MEFEVFLLSNGIRVVHKQINDSDVAHFGLFVNAGTRDESTKESGAAHFLEHALFKGTNKRKSYHIINRLDSVGGELNAFTSKEDTCIHASFVTAHFERAAELISDIVFNSTFPEKEIIKEREVIIDEIHSYLDSPSEQIFDDFEQLIFRHNTLANPILGTIESVGAMESKTLKEFKNRHYAPTNMVISSVTSLPKKKVQYILEKYFGSLAFGDSSFKRKPFKSYPVSHEIIEKNGHQSHCVLGSLAYKARDKKRLGLIMLNNILGGPAMNSRLNLVLREKHGLTYNVESSYTAFSDIGLFTVYFACDKKFVEKSMKVVYKEFERIRENKLTTNQLHLAKQQIVGQIALGMESKNGQMLGLGKSLLMYDKIDTYLDTINKIMKLTSSELLDIANEIFQEDNFFSLKYN